MRTSLVLLVTAAVVLTGGCTGASGDDDDDSTPTPSPTPTVTPTPTPAPIQLESPAVTVASGEERLDCYYTTIPSSVAVNVGSIDATLTSGLVSVMLFRTAGEDFPDGTTSPCGGGASLPVWLFSAHDATASITFPPGTGMPMDADQPVFLQLHYANATLDPIAGAQATLTLGLREGTLDPVGTMATFSTTIDLDPMSTGSVTGQCDTPDDAGFFRMTTHSRKLTTSVRINRFDMTEGAELLETTDWENPAVATFDPAITFAASEKLAYTCDYSNTSSITVQDGDSSSDETCMTTSYYSPATVNTVCVDSFAITEPF